MAEKRILMVVPPQGFHDEQYQVCRRIWEHRGHKVSVASLVEAARGEADTAIPVDIAIKDVKSYDYDAIVFLGGEGARLLFDDEPTRKLAWLCPARRPLSRPNSSTRITLAPKSPRNMVHTVPELSG